LQELIALWWEEAEKYNVLPLDSRMQARMAEPKPLAARPTGRYVYYPGGAASFEYTAVNVKNRSHTITASVEIPAGGAEGVLLAHGSWFAGYSLYVQDGRLHYVHNYLGLAEYRVSSADTLPTGAVTLRFQFRKTGEHRGIGTLFVNDAPAGEGEIPQTVPGVIETSGEGLCCGYDSGLPVTDQYQAPFRFTGTIKRVVVEVDGVEDYDPEAQLRAAFSTQ
jgi:arylsulfatase